MSRVNELLKHTASANTASSTQSARPVVSSSDREVGPSTLPTSDTRTFGRSAPERLAPVGPPAIFANPVAPELRRTQSQGQYHEAGHFFTS